MKFAQRRFKGAYEYIHQRIDSNLATHLEATLRAGNVSQWDIGGDLGLGGRDDTPGDAAYDDLTSQRQALRALLLCQRVYFSKIWAECDITQPGGEDSYRKLDTYGDWRTFKNQSLAVWGGRPEAEIVDGLRAFTITSQNAADAATVADDAGNVALSLPVIDLRRSNPVFPGHSTCYAAVMHWLFRAGLVSYRWMMLHGRGSLQVAGLRRAFGRGRVIWDADRPFLETDHLPTVPAGHVVHLYVDNTMQWRGHWLISAGDGTAFGCNNDEEGGLVNRIHDRCSLDRQFRAYKGEMNDQAGKKFLLKGIAEVFDPLDLPKRL